MFFAAAGWASPWQDIQLGPALSWASCWAGWQRSLEISLPVSLVEKLWQSAQLWGPQVPPQQIPCFAVVAPCPALGGVKLLLWALLEALHELGAAPFSEHVLAAYFSEQQQGRQGIQYGEVADSSSPWALSSPSAAAAAGWEPASHPSPGHLTKSRAKLLQQPTTCTL